MPSLPEKFRRCLDSTATDRDEKQSGSENKSPPLRSVTLRTSLYFQWKQLYIEKEVPIHMEESVTQITMGNPGFLFMVMNS